jgi:hypothetical protein
MPDDLHRISLSPASTCVERTPPGCERHPLSELEPLGAGRGAGARAHAGRNHRTGRGTSRGAVPPATRGSQRRCAATTCSNPRHPDAARIRIAGDPLPYGSSG